MIPQRGVATEGHPYKNNYRIIVLRAFVGVALGGHPTFEIEGLLRSWTNARSACQRIA